MILKRVMTFVLISCTILFTSCYGSWNIFDKGNNVDERSENLKILSDSTDYEFSAAGISSLKGKYTVLIISDVHFGSMRKKVDCERLFTWLDNLKGDKKYPVFALSLGDDVDHGFSEEYELYMEFCKKLRNSYGIKLIINACGNHDIYQNNWDNWERNCYPYTSFYKFNTQKFSWYCLDTASGTIGLNQYEKLISAFDNDPCPKIVFTHYPLMRFNYDCSNMAETTERNSLISDFSKNNVRCVLGGHNHSITFNDLGYYDYGIPSLCYNDAWALLCIDEAAERADIEIFR